MRQLKRWDNGKVIYEGDFNTNKELVEGAVREGLSLKYTNMANMDLSGADLRHTDLKYANLRHANLESADLESANIDFASWPLWCGSIGVIMDEKQL